MPIQKEAEARRARDTPPPCKHPPLRDTFLRGSTSIAVPELLSTKFLNHRNFKDRRNFIYSFQMSRKNVSPTTRLNSIARVERYSSLIHVWHPTSFVRRDFVEIPLTTTIIVIVIYLYDKN